MFTGQITDSSQTFVSAKISSGFLTEKHNMIWPISSVPDTQMPIL